ncbi:MAG TPA: tetratricopeptide repeat protein [Blastocatellia bacterium]|nr:tetratricopeptide repeat protein [Blastocatellia bacterium]
MQNRNLKLNISASIPVLSLISAVYFLLVIACAAAQAPTIQSATDELNRGNYQSAITAFNRLLSSNPNDAQAQAGLLRAYLETGKYAEAEEAAKKYISANSGNDQAHLALGEVYATTGRYAEAIAEFEKTGTSKQAVVKLRGDLRRAEMLRLTGKEEDAQPIFQSFVRYYNNNNPKTAEELTLVARALIHLEKYKDANDLILNATQADPSFIEAHLVGGELFTEKYNYAEAVEFFKDAFKVNPNSARAHLGVAANRKISGGEEMLVEINKALEINPNYVEAKTLRAFTEIEAEQFDKAAADLDSALKINPNSLEALSLKAAMFWVQDRAADYDNSVKAVLAINPRDGMLYETLSHFATINRRYAQAADFSAQAVKLSPRLWQAHLSLGIALIRLGKDAEGRAEIDASFKGDPFNVWAKNSLDLMDAMNDYTVASHGPFTIKSAGKESGAVEPYAASLLEEAQRALSAKYKFTPKAPITVEIFPNHEDFAVRALGLPGLGALGVCFGQTLALDSPSARKAGEFNWGSTLWHEYTHVITLQMTDYRIPRWFSEGLSVYEERKARPGWGDDWSVITIKSFNDGRWAKIADLDGRFLRPKAPDDVQLGYFQASQVCEFVTDKFGFDAILDMLRRYRDKEKTPDILKASLKLTEDEFDRAFNEYIRGKIGKYQRALEQGLKPGFAQLPKEAVLSMVASNPDDFALNLRAGMFYREAGDADKAITHLKRAIEVFPYSVSGGNAYEPLAELYEKRGDKAAAADVLVQLLKIDENNLVALKKLAQLRLALGDKSGALEALRQGFFVSPFDPGAHTQAGDLYLAGNEAARAATEYQVALSLNPPNLAEAHYNVARAYLAAGKPSEARKAVLRSLEVAPGFDKAQELLLKLTGKS